VKLALTRGCIPNSEKLSNRYILNSSSRTTANNATADGSINWAEPSIFPESSLGIGVSVSIRLEPSLRQQLEAMARAEDRPLSYLIRRALRETARREQQGEAAA
jgi:hypothetical protein